MAENQLSVSDVKIKQIMLWRPGTPKIDLTPHFGELNLYESVFHNSMTANLTLVEAVNLPEKFPILGEELIIIDFTVTGMPDGHDLNMNPLYMYVHELIDCMFFVIKNSNEKINAFNVGPKDGVKCSEIA